MIRNYICKGCGASWRSEDLLSSYLQKCPECLRNTRPKKKPSIVHYTVRGLDPRNTLCGLITVTDNFALINVTCPDCLRILSDGTGLYGKCYHCHHKSSPINKAYWRFCGAEPLPIDEVVFVHGNFLNADPADKGCTSQFKYKQKWVKLFEKSIHENRKRT